MRDPVQELLEDIARLKGDRAREMPDDAGALKVLFRAYTRLKEMGWRDAMYCPKDGTVFESISMGSTGIFDCYYEGDWPTGTWWTAAHGDLWPGRPQLYRLKKPEQLTPATET
jgi:hypothetical protein